MRVLSWLPTDFCAWWLPDRLSVRRVTALVLLALLPERLSASSFVAAVLGTSGLVVDLELDADGWEITVLTLTLP